MELGWFRLSHIVRFWLAVISLIVVLVEVLNWATGDVLSHKIEAAAYYVSTTTPFDIVHIFMNSAADKIAQVVFTGRSSYSCGANEIGCWHLPEWTHWPMPLILVAATFNGLYQALSVQGVVTLGFNLFAFVITAAFIVPVTNAAIGKDKRGWWLGVIIDVFLLVLLGSVMAWVFKMLVLGLLHVFGAILAVLTAAGMFITVTTKGTEIAELALVARKARRQAQNEMG